MDIRDMHHKEVAHWKNKYKRCVTLCKTVWEYRDYIEQVKTCLAQGDDLGASELWNELDYPVQKYLITAPTYGGPFTTKERAQVTQLWEIKEEDLCL